MATILCIEDEILLRKDIADELRISGYEVLEAENGKLGLNQILENHPDLVLCDISMPVMTGRQLLDELVQNHPDYIDIPFVFLTALADKQEILDGLRHGADDYLTKPIDFDVLMAKVDSIIRQQGILEAKKKNEQVKLYKALKTDIKTEPETTPNGNENKISGDFQANLKNCMDHSSGSAGKLHLIGLNKLKERYKENWEEVSSRILIIAERTIKKALQPKDAFSRYGKDSFVVLFASLGKKEGAFKAQAIVRDIVTKLVGEDHAEEKDLGISVLIKDISEIQECDGADVGEQLKTAIENEPAETPLPPASVIDQLDPLFVFETQISIKFLPLWDAQKEKVNAFGVLAERHTSYGTFFGSNVLHGGGQDPYASTLDKVVIERLSEVLEQNAESTACVILPIHQDSLNNRNGTATRQLFNTHRRMIKKNSIACELVGISDHASPNRIRETVSILKEYFNDVYVRFGEPALETSSYDNLSIDYIGVDYSEVLKTSLTPNKIKFFEKLATRAKKMNAKPYILGIDGRKELVSCLASGVRHICGRQVSDIIDLPTKAYPLSGRDIL